MDSVSGQPTAVDIDPEPPDYTPTSPDTEPNITLDEMQTTLSTCKPSGAPGIDKITNKMLKLCPLNTLEQLRAIFNASLKLSHLPANWKASNIKMIHKKGKPKDSVSSYRPISLINCISKWLEKIINGRIQNWAESNLILPPCQSGFRKKKSCQDHIARLDQYVTEGFNKKEKTGLVMFDLEKAFDKASHQGIIYKLRHVGLPAGLLNWTENFLTNRTFHVTWNSTHSKAYTTKTGVPQGSCLSPTLFNIFFSDIAAHIPPQILKALYADDLGILFRSSDLKEITTNLQSAIDAITSFCNKWGLKINKSKTTYMVFTTAGRRSNYERTYKLELHIDNASVPMEPSPVFLGIKLDPKLSYKSHLEHITAKIMNRTRLIKKVKSLNLHNQTPLCTTIFKSLVRPILDYAFVPIISPTQTIAGKLQTLQTRALRSIKYFPLKTSTNTIHSTLNIDLLAARSLNNARKFALARLTHPQLLADYTSFLQNKAPNAKHKTIFDKIPNFFL